MAFGFPVNVEAKESSMHGMMSQEGTQETDLALLFSRAREIDKLCLITKL